MAEKQWAFIRNLAVNKFFQAAKAGVMTGQPPYTFGAIFCVAENIGLNLGTLFGDGVPTTSGFAISQFGNSLIIGEGTLESWSGNFLNDGTPLGGADPTAGTFDVGDANLVNHNAGLFDPDVASGGAGGTTPAFAWMSPRRTTLIYIAATIAAGGNFIAYCNGRVVGSVAAASVVNANPVRIGLDAAGANPSGPSWLAGTFYAARTYTASEIAAHQRACAQAKDVVNFGSFDIATPLDYIWSVKRSRLWDGRTAWVSDGGAATAIPMNLTGTLAVSGAGSDLLAADVPWMTV